MKKNTTALQKAETPAPDVGPILDLHERNPEGYIAFVRKFGPDDPPEFDKYGTQKVFDTLGAIRTDELRSMFPSVASWLIQDSYFSVNDFCRVGGTIKKTGLPWPLRSKKDLQKLTACYSDIDCGRPESDELGAALEWEQVKYKAGVLANIGVIPPPSMTAFSGRGGYLFWFLRDEKDPTKLPHAWPEKRAFYEKCNKSLIERLRADGLPADIKAHDATRILRVPGSIHRKSGRRVTYQINFDQYGKGFVYTLREMGKFLGVPFVDNELPSNVRQQAKHPLTKTINRGSAPARAESYRALHARRAVDLITIETWRDGFNRRGVKYEDGFIPHTAGRRYILDMYAGFLRGAKQPKELAIKALKSMGANMKPPYPSDSPADDPPIENIVHDVYKEKYPRAWNRDILCSVLGITDDVARKLELKTIRSEAVAIEEYKARPLKADLVNERREFAAWLLEKRRREGGGPMGCRELARIYEQVGFVGANHETANQDLNAIDYKTELGHRKGGRPRKTYKG